MADISLDRGTVPMTLAPFFYEGYLAGVDAFSNPADYAGSDDAGILPVERSASGLESSLQMTLGVAIADLNITAGSYRAATVEERARLRQYLELIDEHAKLDAADLLERNPALSRLKNPLTRRSTLESLWSRLSRPAAEPLPLGKLIVGFELDD